VGDPGEETHYLYLDRDSNYRIQVFKDLLENGKTVISKFKNIIGSATYRNRAVSDIFEPGSVFKAIAMAIALDDGDVTPTTTYNDHGPIKVDEFEIHNATDTYYGITTMRGVLERSLNTGMAFVARKMGRELFGRYLKKFGFGERTYIEFEDEADAKFKDSSRWAESELVTYAFGQGIAVTPIQFITAISALANKGILMKPHIVEAEPEQVRRVISEKTAATISAMMVSVVESSATQRAAVPGYKVAGKTGTAQTYKHGKPLTGPGTTIASFIGFGPFQDPRFAILVKIDRPRSSIWSDATATPLFAEIAGFLFKYYNVPPEA
jgi:cell division protein FtsI/penicillin-binding protein 2